MSPKKVLLVAATVREVEDIALSLGCNGIGSTESNGAGALLQSEQLDCLVTGVGQFFTTLALTETFRQGSYATAIQVGIGGSFSDDYPIGSVVSIVEDGFADCGAESLDGFLDLFEMGLWEPDKTPFSNGIVLQQPRALRQISGLPEVRGVTVNRTLSSQGSIRWVVERFSPIAVSMEGAPFLYLCAYFGVPCLQIRAISDRVGPRDKAAWDISGAIKELQKPVCDIVTRLFSLP
jgi:futalosine hydrolase